MTPPASGNIISAVGIKAVDYRGNCIDIEVNLQSGCVPVVRGSNGQPVSTSRYDQYGVLVRRHREGVRVAVPNCENAPLVVWVLCEESRNQSMIKFVISRGVNLRPTAHGILGMQILSCNIVKCTAAHVLYSLSLPAHQMNCSLIYYIPVLSKAGFFLSVHEPISFSYPLECSFPVINTS